MKKGLKFWSKLLIASFFLGATVTSAVAQNGATTANCGTSLITVTRTANEVNAGTEITLNFSGNTTDIIAGDNYYFVARQGASVDTIYCSSTVGKNLKVVAVNDGVPTTAVDDEIAKAGTFVADGGGLAPIKVKVQAINELPDAATTLELGVFIKSQTTGCFSDVNWVTIQVLGNIYASLTLNGTNPYEYICHGATTNTNIGFTLCNLPAVTGTVQPGELKYKITATPEPNITGAAVAASAGTIDAGTTWNATITGITANETHAVGSVNYAYGYTVEIGQQKLYNANASVAEEIVYSFSEMTYTYMDGTRKVVLPIVFETPSGKCHDREIYDSTFTVYVAPNFRVQALAFKTDADRQEHVTTHPNLTYYEETNTELTAPTFCQGTIAYFRAINTTEDGTIVYSWTPSNIELDATNIEYPTSKQLTSITLAYSSDVLATWNKDGKFGDGCTADTTINITITPAPILLLATDKAISGDDQTWNSTDVITYTASVCPGEIIKIETDASATILATDDANDMVGLVDPRDNYMTAGDYVQANGAQIKYTIAPNDGDPAVGAYTTWRTDQPAGDGSETLNVAHYLNNGTASSATITYTLENASNAADACALVKSDGSSLPNGQVKVVYTVSPRPQFGLSAN